MLSVTGLAKKRLSKGSMYRLKDGGGYFRGNEAAYRQCSVGVDEILIIPKSL